MPVIAVKRGMPMAAAVLLLQFLTQEASGQMLRGQRLWVANGRIRAVEREGRSLYIGGDFSYVGPLTGSAVALRLDGGGLTEQGARLAGTVFKAASDGTGGWFVGGERLGHAGSAGPQYIVHILADGRLDPVEIPQPNGPVHAIARRGNTLFIGGDFTQLAGRARRGAGAIEISSRALLDWDPEVSGVTTGGARGILDLLVLDDFLIAAGNFTRIGGQSRLNAAALDFELGKSLAWNPGTDYSVNQVVSAGDKVLLGGVFTMVARQPRASLAAVDRATGALLAWNPGSNGQVYALTTNGTTLYAGGTFTILGAQIRFGAGAIDVQSGAVESWDPQPDVNFVSALALSGTQVFLSGGFVSLVGQPRLHLGAVDNVTGEPTPWLAHAGKEAVTMAADDQRLLVAGSFTSVGGVARAFGAALDLATGKATRWNPEANGSITSIAMGDKSIFVAGGFNHIGGAARSYAAELDPDRGLATAWNPPSIDIPPHNVIKLTPERVYVGGDFASIGGRAQGGLAELDRATGALTSRNVGTEPVRGVGVDALVVDRAADVLYVGGLFGSLAGSLRRSLGAVDLRTGLATAWNPTVSGQVLAMDEQADTLYVGGDFDEIGDVERPNAGAVLKSTGNVTDWNPKLTGGDEVFGTILAIKAVASAVYAGGSFTLVGGVPHLYVAAVDPVLGTRLNWDPEAGDSLGLGFSGFVYAIKTVGRSAVLGGDFDELVGSPRSGLGVVSNAGSLSAR